jgi:hypothetical protein
MNYKKDMGPIYPQSDCKKMKIDQSLTKLIIAKSLPLTFVEGPDFKDITNSLDIRYVAPCPRTIRNTLLPANVVRLKNNIMRILQAMKKLNISTDLWSDPDLRSFIAFGAQGVDEQWKLIKCIIGVRRLIGSHTNTLIYEEFVKLAKEYGIEDKLFKVISDGGSNVVKAFDEAHMDQYCAMFDELLDEVDIENIEKPLVLEQNEEEEEEDVSDEELVRIMKEIDTNEIVASICKSYKGIKRHPCAAHVMQLIINDALKEETIQELIKKVLCIFIYLFEN